MLNAPANDLLLAAIASAALACRAALPASHRLASQTGRGGPMSAVVIALRVGLSRMRFLSVHALESVAATPLDKEERVYRPLLGHLERARP